MIAPKRKSAHAETGRSTALIRQHGNAQPEQPQVESDKLDADAKMIRVHPTAMEFPTLPAKEMKELKEDIAANGIRVPLLFNKAETMLIDGRNRWYCAQELKIAREDLPIEHFEGEDEDIPSVIISRNLFRRHLDNDQRLALVTKLLRPQLEAEARERQRKGGREKVSPKSDEAGRVDEQIAKKAKDTKYRARQAIEVDKAGLSDDVIAGKTPWKDATKKAKAAPAKQPKSTPKKVSQFRVTKNEAYVWFRDRLDKKYSDSEQLEAVLGIIETYVSKQGHDCQTIYPMLVYPDRTERTLKQAVDAHL